MLKLTVMNQHEHFIWAAEWILGIANKSPGNLRDDKDDYVTEIAQI